MRLTALVGLALTCSCLASPLAATFDDRAAQVEAIFAEVMHKLRNGEAAVLAAEVVADIEEAIHKSRKGEAAEYNGLAAAEVEAIVKEIILKSRNGKFPDDTECMKKCLKNRDLPFCSRMGGKPLNCPGKNLV